MALSLGHISYPNATPCREVDIPTSKRLGAAADHVQLHDGHSIESGAHQQRHAPRHPHRLLLLCHLRRRCVSGSPVLPSWHGTPLMKVTSRYAAVGFRLLAFVYCPVLTIPRSVRPGGRCMLLQASICLKSEVKAAIQYWVGV